jgi:hypothetical protein
MVALRETSTADTRRVPVPPAVPRSGGEPLGAGAGGPVGEMLADLDARLSADEYAHWLLPPEERSATERLVHWLSLGSGVIALTAGAGLVWFIL